MKTLVKSCYLLGAMLLGLNTSTLQAQTLTCGAVSTNVGAQLKFINGTNFAADSGFVLPLTYQRFVNHLTGTRGSYWYSGTNLYFQALSAKTNSPGAAAPGAYLACQILSVSGPAGGKFYFWESIAGWPTYVFPVGGVYSSNKSQFDVGNIELGAGSPGGDTYGNITGRRFTVDIPGEYLVTFRLVDISKNHPTDTNAPIHSPSDPITIKFATRVDVNTTRFSYVKTNGVVTMAFKQGGLTNMYVETASDIAGVWTPVAGPFTNAPVGTNITTLTFTNNPGLTKIFYRLHGATP